MSVYTSELINHYRFKKIKLYINNNMNIIYDLVHKITAFYIIVLQDSSDYTTRFTAFFHYSRAKQAGDF